MRIALAASTAALLALSLTSCGSTDDPAAQPTPTPSITESPSTPTATSSTPAGPVVNVTIDGDNVTPKGDRIKAKVNEPITFVVTSDRAGGLHVHSSPEQSPEFTKGTTTIEVTIDKPGVVEVEEHESGALIVQLEVR